MRSGASWGAIDGARRTVPFPAQERLQEAQFEFSIDECGHHERTGSGVLCDEMFLAISGNTLKYCPIKPQFHLP